MWLPHDCRGIKLGNFILLARDTKLATDGILSAHARSVFFEYINAVRIYFCALPFTFVSYILNDT